MNRQPVKNENQETPRTLEAEHLPPVGEKEKNPHALGWITILVIFGLLGIWAVTAQIETTVQASGKVISKGYKKLVQHPRGGLVTKLYVHEGDRVKKGEPILQLDDVEVDSRLQTMIRQHDDLLTQSARLEAEANLSDSPDFQAILPRIIDRQNLKERIAHQRRLFESDMHQLQQKERVIASRNRVLEEQNRGLKAQIESLQRQLDSYREELAKWEKLYQRKMTDELKLLDLRRKIESIEGQIAQTRSKIRENEATIRSNEEQIALEKSRFVDEARKTLQDHRSKLANLEEQIRSLRNQKKRLLITSPESGTVVDMQIHGSGEVVPAQKPIASVLPEHGNLILEAFVQPTDIDKVHLGQEADIKFPSYVDPAAKPIEGKVTYISADTLQPPGAKQPFYKVLVEITPKGMKAIRENGFEIVPGMPTSIFIKAGKRSFLGYILLPLEQLARGAFHAN